MKTYIVEIKIQNEPGGPWKLWYLNSNIRGQYTAQAKYDEKMAEARLLLPAGVTGLSSINPDL